MATKAAIRNAAGAAPANNVRQDLGGGVHKDVSTTDHGVSPKRHARPWYQWVSAPSTSVARNAWQAWPSTAKAAATGLTEPLNPVSGLSQLAGAAALGLSNAVCTAALARAQSSSVILLEKRRSRGVIDPVAAWSSDEPKIGPSCVEIAQPQAPATTTNAAIGRSALHAW
jgi:hypothetical protein